MVTIYEKESGKAVIFAHIVDAKESLKTGFYVTEDPTIKKNILPDKSEAKPTVIPKIEDKKPAKVEEKKVPVVTKTESVSKVVPKKSPKIIKK